MTFTRTYLAFFGLAAVMQATAQGPWSVDSLLATWPIEQRLQEQRTRPKPGRMPDIDRLYAQLKQETPALPVFVDSLVERLVQAFANERREHFRVMMGAAEAQLPAIERELAGRGMPDELKYLPFALSAYNPQAAGQSGRAGPWMLSYPEALHQGISVTSTVDERRDPRKSTVAALERLQELHARYGDWPTAVIAFTCGPANLERARRRSGSDRDPRVLYPHFDPAHRDILPALMAFTFLAVNAEDEGLEPLVFRVTEPNDTVRFDSTLHIHAITSVVGTRPTRFRAINPTLTGGIVPAGTPFLLPRSEAERFQELAFIVLEAQGSKPREPIAQARREEDPIDKLPDGREATLYRIAEGDCLGCIAERFGVGLSDLKRWNELKSDDIELGNTLIIYLPPTDRLRYESDTVRVATAAPEALRRERNHAGAGDGDFVWYTVRSGDSLYMIAKKYPGISADDLMRHNGIGADIRPGQKIKIPKR